MSNELMVIDAGLRLGSFQLTTAHSVVESAAEIAKELAKIVEDRKLYSLISGRKFVRVEGWTTLGAMLGVTPREVVTVEHEEDFESTVELVRASDGLVIGRGSAICGNDELDRNGKSTWGSRPRYARRSMAITRATGKAFRLSFSWIMTLAGYEATPLEEMDTESEYRGTNPNQSQIKTIAPSPRVASAPSPVVRQSWAASSALITRISENIPYYGQVRPHIINSLKALGESGELKLEMTDDEAFAVVDRHAHEEADKKAAAKAT